MSVLSDCVHRREHCLLAPSTVDPMPRNVNRLNRTKGDRQTEHTDYNRQATNKTDTIDN